MWRLRDFDIKSSFVSNQTVTSTLSSLFSFLLYQLGYNLLSYRLGYNLLYISTSSFWSRSLMHLTKPRPSSLLDGWLVKKDYLQISAFLDLVVMEQGSSSRSMKSHWRSHEWSGEKTASRTQLGLTLRRQHQLLLPFCIVKARLPCMVETEEGLDVTLDDLAGLRRWILMDSWI